jgi:hypothetical protein
VAEGDRDFGAREQSPLAGDRLELAEATPLTIQPGGFAEQSVGSESYQVFSLVEEIVYNVVQVAGSSPAPATRSKEESSSVKIGGDSLFY